MAAHLAALPSYLDGDRLARYFPGEGAGSDGDGRDSRIASLDEDKATRRLRPTFVERTFGFFRAYYEVVPKGKFTIAYTVRINNAGNFGLPPTRVEAMYAPEMFGEAPNAGVAVGE